MNREQELQERLDTLKEHKKEVKERHKKQLKPINKAIHSVTQMLYREITNK